MEIIIYVLLFAVLFFVEKAYIVWAQSKGIEDNPGERSSHKELTVRGGGFLFFLTVLGYWVYSGFSYPYFFAALSVLSIVSFIDDLYNLSPRTRLVCQVVAMALLVSQITTSSVGIIMALIVLSTGVVNLVNFLDGINGMLCGVSLVILGELLYIDDVLIHFIDPHFIICVLVADLVFCCYNFKTKAECFAGDVGSMSMGLILFFLIIKLVWVSDDFRWFVLLSVFLVDGGLTIVHRILLRENIFLPHRKHAYEIMVNELHVSHLKVSFLYIVIQVSVSVWYILFPTMTSFIAAFLILCSLYLGFMIKFYHLHEESLAQSRNLVMKLSGKTVIIVGKVAKKSIAQFINEEENVHIVELEEWDEGVVNKYKPTMILFE